MRSLLFSTLLLSGFASCRSHTLEDGTYAISTTDILRDDCGLTGQSVLDKVTLVTTGHLVNASLSKPEGELVGTYRSGTDELILDGTFANQQVVIGGRTCLVQTTTIHSEADTLAPNAFAGTMSIRYDAPQPDECNCQFWFNYEATRIP